MDAPALPLPHGLSFIKLIQDADPIVQAVMLGLALVSIVCWGIGFEKLIRYAFFSRQLRGLERFVASRPGEQLPAQGLAARFRALAGSEPRPPAHGLGEFQANLERSLQSESATYMRRLQSGLSLLATVDTDRAIAVAMIVNELITNAAKYAYEGKLGGQIWVTIARTSRDRFEIKVRDEGKGLPPNFDPCKAQSLGMRIVSPLELEALDDVLLFKASI